MLNDGNLIRVAVLISGGGTNLQAIIDASNNNELPSCEIVLVISNKKDAYGLKRAENVQIKTEVLKDENQILNALDENMIDMVVLAGFLKILSKDFVKRFQNRIINIHPSLIPSFCGKGAYGIKVHEMALSYGVKVTGATVHYVNEIADGGKIIFQKAVEVKEDDTPERLQKRVMQQAEWVILPKAVEFVAKKILNTRLNGGKSFE